MGLNTEMKPEGLVITDKDGGQVAIIYYRTHMEMWYLKMDEKYHGGINRNWYKTMKGAEYAALAAWYDEGNE